MLRHLLFIALLFTASTLVAQDTGKKYALLIGVETYDPSVLRPLEFCEDDVIALGTSLDRLGFSSIVMTRENSIPARRPGTAKKINDQLDGVLKLIKSDKDTLVVVLSGHGLQYKDDPLDAEKTKETFFCPEEADPKDRASLVSISALSKKVTGSNAGKKLLVIDACRNEVTAKGNKALEEELEPVGRRARTELSGMYALFSCAPKEKSWEHPELKHGVFISQMIKYLDGQAESSLYPRQQVSIQQMAAFASRETTEFVFKRLNQEQTPELVGKGTDWSLGRIGIAGFPIGTRAGEERELTALKVKFCWCPPGTFTMGSPKSETDRSSDEDQVQVTLSKGFWMGKYEVTQSEWQQVMRTTIQEQAQQGTFLKEAKGVGARFPMHYVNHDEATEFCRKLTDQERRAGRLPADWEIRRPSEAEREYACRAGTSTPWAFGNSLSSTLANVDGKGTTEVGSYRPNDWGLCDMHGNVWEWCSDWYAEKLPGGRDPAVLQVSGASFRVYRGGCWYDYPQNARAADRSRLTPGLRVNALGFRVLTVQYK